MFFLPLYLRPLYSLIESWPIKAVGSAIILFLADQATHLFAIRVDFVALLIVLVIVDTLTGIAAAKRRGERVRSRRFRSTAVKTIEYTLFIGIVAAISNTLGVHGEIPIISATLIHLTEVAIIYVVLTELVSIYENLSPGSGPQRVLGSVIIWLKGKRGPDGPMFEGVLTTSNVKLPDDVSEDDIRENTLHIIEELEPADSDSDESDNGPQINNNN